jgi:hypothetical protein
MAKKSNIYVLCIHTYVHIYIYIYIYMYICIYYIDLGSRSTPRRHFFVCGTLLLCTLVAWFTHQLAVEFLGTDSEKVAHMKKGKKKLHTSVGSGVT